MDTLIFDEGRKFPNRTKEEEYGGNLKLSNNLANMEELSEVPKRSFFLSNSLQKSIVDTLRARYSSDVIYTYIGDILLACNPFKQLTIYGEKFRDIFLPSSQRPDALPHIYALALVCLNAHGQASEFANSRTSIHTPHTSGSNTNS